MLKVYQLPFFSNFFHKNLDISELCGILVEYQKFTFWRTSSDFAWETPLGSHLNSKVGSETYPWFLLKFIFSESNLVISTFEQKVR